MTPSSITTILFTDLVGSTELQSQLGDDEMQAVRRAHFVMLGDQVAAHHGEVVKSLGDGIMAVCASPSDAVACAVAIQQGVTRQVQVASRATPGARPAALTVRVGLSAGEAIIEDGDYHGTPVVEAARLCAAARGGQILVAEVVRLLTGSRGSFSFTSVGPLELKGLPGPVVAHEVGWEPLPVTPAIGLPLPGQLSVSGQFAFAGRAAERQRLAEQWQAAAAGERRIVLVGGEPGIGKTRIAAQLAGVAHAAGAIVLAGRCDEDLVVPYAPFAEALRPLVEQAPVDLLNAHIERYGGDLARLVPELRRRSPALPEPQQADPETERWCLFEALVSLLANASALAPVLLVLDDLHWAGKPALLLLRHLARFPEPMALLVVATYRDTDLARTHPLTDMLADLRREPGVERLALRGLDADGVTAMVAAAAGSELGEPGRVLAAAVARETEGNPFFVQEILRHLVETGALRRDADGRWMSDLRVEQLHIPEGIREVVGRRLSRLSETANRVLATAAVIGPHLDIAVLEALDGPTGSALLDALDEARRARLLNEEEPGQYRFTHAVVRQTLLEELGTTRRVRLHLQIGAAIERLAGERIEPQLSALAHHFSEAAVAGGAARAVKYSRLAGDSAMQHVAWEEAAAHYERALTAMDLDSTLAEPARDALRCDLLTELGEACTQANNREVGRAAAAAAAGIARRLGDPTRLASAALAYGFGDFSFGIVDTTHLDLLDEATKALPIEEHLLRALLLSRKVGFLDTSGSDLDTRAIASDALVAARKSGAAGAIRSAFWARSRSLGGMPDLENYEEAARQMLETESEGRHGGRRDYFSAQAAVRRGDSKAFVQHHEGVLRDTERFRMPAWFAVVAQWDAARALWEGRFEEARRLSRRTEELTPNDPSFHAASRDQRAVARIETGSGAHLIEGYKSLVTTFPSFAYARAALAYLRAEAGDVDAARRDFEGLAANSFAAMPYGISRPATLHRLAEACVSLGDSNHAAQLYEILLPYAGQLLIAFLLQACLAAADRDLGVLAATMGRLDDAERHLLAAEQLEDGFGAPPLAARTRLALARVLLQRAAPGDADRARALLSSVVTATAAMGMAGVERGARELLQV